MRLPTLTGGLAGLVLGLAVLAVALAGLKGETIDPPHTAPSLPPVATASPTSEPTPTASPLGASATGGGPIVGVQVGDRAPALRLPELGGGFVDLATVVAKPAWVSFTASWCPSCRDEIGLMNAFQVQLGDRLAMIVVDVKESPDTVASLVSQTNLRAPVGLDRTGAASATWQAFVLPVHFWVDATGIIRYVVYGAPGPDQFIAGVHSVLPGASLTP